MRDIDDIRRDNLRLIEQDHGSPSAAAAVVGMSPAQFANLRDGARDSKTGRPRGMRKETARRIEKAAGKPPGWLDADHTSSVREPRAAYSSARTQPDDAEAAMLSAYRAASGETRAAVDLVLRPSSERGALDAQLALAIAVLEERAVKAIHARKTTRAA